MGHAPVSRASRRGGRRDHGLRQRERRSSQRHTLANEARDRIGALSFDFVSISVLPLARGVLVARFLETGATHLLQWDDDVVVRPEAVWRLLELDLPLVGAGYRWRTEHIDFAVKLTPEQIEQEALPDGTIRCDGLGGGLMLWRRDALERLDKAHRRLAVDEGVLPPTSFHLEYQDPSGVFLTEDYAASARWRELSGEDPRLLLDVDTVHCECPREYPGNYAKDIWSRRRDLTILTGPRAPVHADSPCPCGAGKPLRDCHGKEAA